MADQANTNGDTDTPSTTEGQQSPAPKREAFGKAIEAMKGMGDETSKEQKELPSDKKESDTQTVDWEKRYKDLQGEKDRQVSETSQQLEDIARDRIEKDPQYIHTLAEKNKALADRIVKNDPGCKEAGIKNYDDLRAYIDKQSMPEESRTLLEKEIDPLKKEIESMKEKMTADEKREAEVFITQFKEQHPEFKGDIEKKTWNLFNSSQLTLEDCLDYIKHKEGIQEDVNQREEKAYQNLQSKRLAGAIPSSGSQGSSARKAQINKETREFLEGIGAKKTLADYGG